MVVDYCISIGVYLSHDATYPDVAFHHAGIDTILGAHNTAGIVALQNAYDSTGVDASLDVAIVDAILKPDFAGGAERPSGHSADPDDSGSRYVGSRRDILNKRFPL